VTALSARERLRRAPLEAARRVALPSLTRRGWAVLAAGAIAVIVALSVGWRDLFYVGLILLVLLVVSSVVLRAGSAALEVERRNSPETVPAGQPFTVSLKVSNGAWLRTPVQRWHDRTPRGVVGSPSASLPALAGRGDPTSSIRLSYAARAEHRGVVEIGPMTVERSDPFGLLVSERTVGSAEPVTVLPRITPLDSVGSGRSSAGDAATVAWRSGHGHDDVVTREYRSGDALRHVNWRASAHRGELMVRQEQSSDEARAVVVLDTRRETYPSAQAFEWAVEYAASIVAHLAGARVDVRLLETVPDGSVDLDIDRDAQEVLVALASVERRSARWIGAAYLERLESVLAAEPAAVHAVLGSGTGAPELRELASHRARTTQATLTLSGSAAAEIPDELWFAGWSAGVAGAATGVDDAWRQVAGGAR